MRHFATLLPVGLSVGLMMTGCASGTDASDGSDSTADLSPTGMHSTSLGEVTPETQKIGEARARTNQIQYHGGPVMSNGVNVYYIWYGTWSSAAQSILTTLAQGLGGSPYFNINTTYFSGSTTHTFVKNIVTYKSSTTDNYSLGKALSDANIFTIVKNAISAGKLPLDSNAVYFVLTASDVNETSGFCTQYCGWHTNGSVNGADVKYAFIGNPARCLSSCAAQTTSPNGDAGADGAASIVSHELEEATTDPDLNAWFDRTGEENADKCAWTFGTESTASNGSKFNVTLAGKQYLIQQNWVQATSGFCAMSH